MDGQTISVVVVGLMALGMVVLPIGMGLFYLFDSEGSWRYAQRRLRSVGIVAAYRTPRWERQRIIGGIFALTVGFVFAYVLVVNFAPLFTDAAALATATSMDGVFVTLTPLGR
jgi:hypothetical protein